MARTARGDGFRLGFQGGQMPRSHQLPQLPGFKNPFKKVYAVVNVSKLSRFENGARVDAEALVEAGLAKGGDKIKILGAGRIKRKLTVEADAISNSAREAIEKAGGSVTVLNTKDKQKQASEPPQAE